MKSARAVLGFATLALALFLCAFPSHADEPSNLSAADLAVYCQSTYDTDYGFCVGYVSALADEMAAGGIDGTRICHFGQARSQQYADLFKAYAQNYPGSLNAPARTIVAAALARAFPCQVAQ